MPISVPTVQQTITDGRAVISGSFDLAEARLLSQRLNAGALEVPIELILQQTIGASLGAESLARSLKAGIIALILVMIFMMIYYRLPGVLSVIALGLYLSVTLALFKLIGVTLTLAGIAGFILSIGLAVDANVLIFERLKEELKAGKSLKAAVEEGFLRAWTSIRDGNISTLITCALLIWFGSSFVQGFAVTLAIGILISIFSAITVTRTMLRFIVPWFEGKKMWAFLGANSKKHD
jgi:preprotein translocase subunit SecD